MQININKRYFFYEFMYCINFSSFLFIRSNSTPESI